LHNQTRIAREECTNSIPQCEARKGWRMKGLQLKTQEPSSPSKNSSSLFLQSSAKAQKQKRQ